MTVKECHAKQVYHGDIKTENILVTSWNWLYLSDFSASFKPTYLPEDNPADFSFFFDISGRRTCYLAPERFLTPGIMPGKQGSMNWAMDIFSVGCVIAELFLETPVFNLSQLFNYRKGDYDPQTLLLYRIEDKDVRDLISHMIQLDPESRFSAEEYVEFWRGKAFPEYFTNFLHQYMALITDPSSGRTAITAGEANLGESDERISRVYHDYEKIAYFLGYTHTTLPNATQPPLFSTSMFPLHLDLPRRRAITRPKRLSAAEEGTFLFLNVITSSLRSTARSSARLQACDLLLAFAEHIPDEAKLDRTLPFVVSLLDDRSDMVKIAALRTLAQLISLITTTSPVNAFVFPEYIIPKLIDLFQPRRNRRQETLVRVTFAQCLAPLAEASSRFLDSIEALKSEGTLPLMSPEAEENIPLNAYQDFYESAKADLIRFFETQAKFLLTDPDTVVRRAFLGSIASLCIFFGSAKTNDVILSHLNTYLNDRDWRLKCAFFDSIIGVAIYVGANNLEEFMLPLMILALTDTEESVVRSVIRSLAVISTLGLFSKSALWHLADLIGRFLIHPNRWIRETAAHFLASSTKFLSTADRNCTFMPLILVYLRLPPTCLVETSLLDIAKRPLSRGIYESALSWAKNLESSSFWKDIQKMLRSLQHEEKWTAISSKGLNSATFGRISKSEVDRQWIARLRSAGMTRDDEIKLMALSEFISRSASRLSPDEASGRNNSFDKLITLNDLGTSIHSFHIDLRDELWNRAPRNNADSAPEARPQTISDALLDASATIGTGEAPLNFINRTGGLYGRQDIDTREQIAARSTSPLAPSSPPGPSQLSPEKHEHDVSPAASRTSSLRKFDELASSSQHGNSAIGLIQRQNSGAKASPNIGTSATNAFGKVDGLPMRHDSSMPANREDVPDESRYIINPKVFTQSGYEGRDPNVLRLLESVALANYPSSIHNTDPEITAVEKRLWNEQVPGSHHDRTWRPSRAVIATFCEHTGPVVRVIVSPDHAFFLTASEDGSIKVWDTGRLERSIAHRSRLTYKVGPDVKLTALCFIENTHVFTGAGSDGTINFVRVECIELSPGTLKYNRMRALWQWSLPNAPYSHAVWLMHKKSRTTDHLLIATNECQIHALDVHSRDIAFTLSNPVSHGTPTCFCTSSETYHWLLIGTSDGVLDLWDLRFLIRLRSFAFPGRKPIYRIVPGLQHSASNHVEQEVRSENPIVYVAGGTGEADITAWDLREFRCVEVWKASTAAAAAVSHKPMSTLSNAGISDSTTAQQDAGPYTAWNPDWIARCSSSTLISAKDVLDGGEQDSKPTRSEVDARGTLAVRTYDNSVRALAVCWRDLGTEDISSVSRGRSHAPYMIAAGPDAVVRFWDLRKGFVSQSCVVTSLSRMQSEGIPFYEQVGARNGINFNAEKILQEKVDGHKNPARIASDNSAGTTTPPKSSKPKSMQKRKAGTESLKRATHPETSKSVQDRMGEQALLRRHLDAVTDVAIIERPYRMIVSVDRSGVILVTS